MEMQGEGYFLKIQMLIELHLKNLFQIFGGLSGLNRYYSLDILRKNNYSSCLDKNASNYFIEDLVVLAYDSIYAFIGF